MKNFLLSFKNAVTGISLGLKERNLKIQLALAILAVLLGLYFKINLTEWMLILVVIGSVITTELLNSSIEELSDRQRDLGTSYKDAGPTRDMAAGAVLMQSVISLTIGMIVFIPKIIEKFF